MKIIALQSVGLGDFLQDGSTGGLVPTQLQVRVGFPFYGNPYGLDNGKEPKVTKIQLSMNGINYIAKTDDKHKFVLPADKYIAEYVESSK